MTQEYTDRLVGAPVSWEHAGGDIVDWASECRSTAEMRDRVERHAATFGRVVDAFALDNRLYATIRLNDGVRVPPPIAEWMQTSLSDICWPASEGHGAPEIIELSGTGSAGRPGCRVLSQIDPRVFRTKMAQESVMSKLNDGQKSVVHNFMKLIDTHPDALAFANGIPPEVRAAINAEMAGHVTNLEKARAADEAQAGAAGAAAQQPPPSRVQELEDFAREMASRTLETYGVPKDMSAGYFAQNPPQDVGKIIPMLEACSQRVMERLGHAKPQAQPADPEPQHKLACNSGDWRARSDHNLSRIKEYRGY
jgi:hypothetical protein